MTWAEILQLSAAGLNDTVRDKYTDDVLLPYLNMARIDLQEIFELNDISVIEETSAIITVPANTSAVGFNTNPALPNGLIEVKQLWESTAGQNQFVPVARRDFVTPYVTGGSTYISFGIWAWQGQEIRLRATVGSVDIKIDYVKSLFASMLLLGGINAQNDVKNSDGFFHFRTAGLASEFIDENTTRATSLNANAAVSLERSLGISVKGMQNVIARRKPFRAGFKSRRSLA